MGLVINAEGSEAERSRAERLSVTGPSANGPSAERIRGDRCVEDRTSSKRPGANSYAGEDGDRDDGDRAVPIVVIQRNPGSGSGRGVRELLLLVQGLRRRGFQVRMFKSRSALDEWVRRPGVQARLRCIVAAGGDGTLADVLNRHPNTTLFPFPMGTENLMARHIGVRRRGEAAAAAIETNRVMPFDTGLVNGRRFLLMVSLGVDADVVHRLHRERTGHIDYWSYLRHGLSSMWRFRAVAVTAEATGRSTPMGVPSVNASGGHVIVTNLASYGFGFRFCPKATPHDGKLDVRIFGGVSRKSGWFQTLSLWLRMPWKDWGVSRFESDHIRIYCVAKDQDAVNRSESARTLPVQCDGDPCGQLLVNPELFSGADGVSEKEKLRLEATGQPANPLSPPVWPVIDILAAPGSLRLIVPEHYRPLRTASGTTLSAAPRQREEVAVSTSAMR